jgi:hypothetical protein
MQRYTLLTVTVGLEAEAEEVAEPVVDELVETLLLEDSELLVEEKTPLVLVVMVVDDVDEPELEDVGLDEAELLELELVTDVLVVDPATVAVPPQTIFSDTARGVAYTVGLAPELAADEA